MDELVDWSIDYRRILFLLLLFIHLYCFVWWTREWNNIRCTFDAQRCSQGFINASNCIRASDRAALTFYLLLPDRIDVAIRTRKKKYPDPKQRSSREQASAGAGKAELRSGQLRRRDVHSVCDKKTVGPRLWCIETVKNKESNRITSC